MSELTRRGFITKAAKGALGAAALSMVPGVMSTGSAEELKQQTPRKITVLLGTGLKDGNAAKLVEAFAQGATEMGHEVTPYFLAEMDIKPCLGCGVCRKGDGTCVHKDDMLQIYDAVNTTDMVVFASPLRHWMFTGMLKNCVERFYAIPKPGDDLPKGTYESYPKVDCALMMTAADDQWFTFNWAKSYYENGFANFFLWNNKGCLFAGGCGESGFGDDSRRIIEETGHLEEAYEFGKNVYAE